MILGFVYIGTTTEKPFLDTNNSTGEQAVDTN